MTVSKRVKVTEVSKILQGKGVRSSPTITQITAFLPRKTFGPMIVLHIVTATLEQTTHSIKIQLTASTVSTERLLAYALDHFPIVDITIHDPPLEQIITQIYQGKLKISIKSIHAATRKNMLRLLPLIL